MQKFFKQKNKAFTLIETLVAISIFTMSILGLMSILASSISNTNYAKQKMTATYLAQEGIEHVRNMRDTDVISATNGWTTFKTDISTSSFSGSYPTDSNFSGFTRTLSADISSFAPDEVKITSTVKCTQCPNSYSITLSEDLFNWVEQ